MLAILYWPRNAIRDGIIGMQTATAAGYFLSPQQSHIWLLQQRAESQFSCQVAVQITGKLDVARLELSLAELVARHEMLRTVFRRQAGMKTPFQVIQDAAEPKLLISQDIVTADALMAEHAAVPFDLEHGPILRAALATTADKQHLLALALPALCADSATLSALVTELVGIYANPAAERPEEALRYVQFAQWQGELLQDTEDEAAVEGRKFWAERAESGEQKIELPQERTSETPGSTGVLELPVSDAMLAQIQSVALAADGSTRDVLLAAWQALLMRLTGRSRLAVGVTLAGREYEELAEAIGPIAKVMPIHARFEGNPTFLEAVGQAKAAVEEAAGSQEYFDPAMGFVEDAPIAFSFTAFGEPVVAAGLQLQVVAEHSLMGGSKLALHCEEGDGRLKLRFTFDSSRYERGVVDQFAAYFVTLLSAAVADPKLLVARLPLLDEAAIARQAYEWNATQAEYPQRTMHSLIEDQVARTPDRMALRCEDRSLSYAEMNRRANQLAHHLRGMGVGAGSLVGLCVDRSENMIVAVLAIHKAGGAYVPLSADFPKARLAQQLAGAVILITEQALKDSMPDQFGDAVAGPVICLDTDAATWASAPETNLVDLATPDDLAYVIYTSGSTGMPKGVGVRHRNLVNYTWAIAGQLKLADVPDGLQFATVSTLLADLGNTCIYPSLVSGGGLHVIPYEVGTDSAAMAEYQSKYPVDVLKIVPSHLRALLQSPDRTKVLPRKYLITGGEALTTSLVAEIAACGAGCALINHYGPTETTVGSLTQPLSALGHTPKLTIPIGRPIANTQVYVLDPVLQLVPEGVTGELFISGAGVSAGYVGQPRLTEERFIANPFVAGATMYRTGDLARYVPGTGGAIEFLGRADDQVKVRGFRIELGEIEAAMLKLPGVRQAVVLAHQESVDLDKQLVAYAIANAGDVVTGEQLRERLRRLLPEYMVPVKVILLEKLPLTLNGKIDRKALPDANAVSFQRPYIPPSTPTERGIATIWEEVLRRQNVSADANFFELGGHSLTATQVVSRIRQQFSISLALRTLFECPVLTALAAAVDAAGPASVAAAAPIRRASREAYRVPIE